MKDARLMTQARKQQEEQKRLADEQTRKQQEEQKRLADEQTRKQQEEQNAKLMNKLVNSRRAKTSG